MEVTQPGTFHLHIDETSGTPEFDAWCKSAGYHNTNFIGHPEGYEHYEPNRHRTLKFTERGVFDLMFDRTCAAAGELGMAGYIEGEFISRVTMIDDRAYADVQAFNLVPRRLEGGEQFREGEVHLTFDADASDPRRIKQFLDAGMFGAYENKNDGRRCLVLTAQGYMKDVLPFYDKLYEFLVHAGGLVGARLKLERAIAHQLFGITPAHLPPIVEKIAWP